jgi:hypothetical protein
MEMHSGEEATFRVAVLAGLLAMLVYMTWYCGRLVWNSLRRGVLPEGEPWRGVTVRRSEKPVLFWFVIASSIIFAALFVWGISTYGTDLFLLLSGEAK